MVPSSAKLVTSPVYASGMRRCAEPGIPPTDPLAFVEAPVEAATRRRRIYEVARKHCGQQDEWAISLELLKKKCGSASEDYEFRRLLGGICNEDQQHHHIPDYAISFDGETVRFLNRKTMKPTAPEKGSGHESALYAPFARTNGELMRPELNSHFAGV